MIVLTSIASFLAAFISFFSGFGLGTILLPVFLVFFAPSDAILATAIVHFFNSTLKVSLTYKNIIWRIVFNFGVFAILSSFLGAYLISQMNDFTLFKHHFFGFETTVTYVSFLLGIVILFFTFLELFKWQFQLNEDKKIYLIGGFLTGFFGGLSGHQGALRSIFFKQLKLPKESFVACSSMIGFAIDVIRISVYLLFSKTILTNQLNVISIILLFSIFSASTGTILGNFVLKKTTFLIFDRIISISLMLFGLALVLGMI